MIRRAPLIAALAVVAALIAPASALAAPAWRLAASPGADYFRPGSSENPSFTVVATNVGDEPTSGQITLNASLSSGLSANEVELEWSGLPGAKLASLMCSSKTHCGFPSPFSYQVQPGESLTMVEHVSVAANAHSTVTTGFSISGGGAASIEAKATAKVSAAAPFEITAFSSPLTESSGEDSTQAGAHPYEMTTTIGTPDETGDGNITEWPTANLKDSIVELPAGLVGNPGTVPRCPRADFHEGEGSAYCPVDSQVGLLTIDVRYSINSARRDLFPVYNLTPSPGQPATLGFLGGGIEALIRNTVRTGADYGITSSVLNAPTALPFWSPTLTIWGVPGDPSHDSERSCPGKLPPQRGGTSCSYEPEGEGGPRAFLTNPTSCGGPLRFGLAADSWQTRGEFLDASYETESGMTGCNQLQFEPTIEARPTSNVADSPTGLQVDLRIPKGGLEEGGGKSEANLRNAVVKLPAGLTINPSSAAGLEGCTPAQFGLTTPVGTTPIHTTAGAAECPDASKIGTVEIKTPLLEHPIGSPGGPEGDVGAVYVAEPYQNPFESLLAIYVAVDDPLAGVVVKLAGDVEIGPEGQLTTRFDENPQLPFEDFKLNFFGGARGALKTPATCGTYATTSSLTPWSAPESGPPATPSDSYAISQEPGGGSCPTAAGAQANSPSFEAGTESPLAGAFSPFVLHLRREDGSQQFSSLTVTPPKGLLGKLAGIPYCPDPALAAAEEKSGKEEQTSPSCPAASEVGTVTVGAGAGPSPYYVTGKAYLAGPYKGAPLSLAIVTPAVAGPYDLGTVVVRSALEVDPYTTQITVKSDPIPAELKGIPLDVRSIAVKMDHSDFTLNPTSCEAMSVGGTETSTLGNTAQLSNRFQVGECGKLGFKPKLSFSLKGATHRAGHPALTATLKMPEGGANIARAQVSLPHAFFLDQGNLNKVCKQAEIASASCPPSSIYGEAKAWSPLLEKPLEGPVYLGVGYGYKLPALVAELDGQIRVLLKGRVDSDKQKGIRNTFEVVPDAPVSKFVLSLKGGAKYGLIENSEPLCAKTQRASARFVGQNGTVAVLHPKLVASCKVGKKVRHKGHSGHSGKK